MSTDSSAKTNELLLEVRGLGTGYGDLRVVWDVSFDVRAGEITVLLGRNGAGKTTTIRTMLHVIRPTAGVVRVLGLDSRSSSHLGRTLLMRQARDLRCRSDRRLSSRSRTTSNVSAARSRRGDAPDIAHRSQKRRARHRNARRLAILPVDRRWLCEQERNRHSSPLIIGPKALAEVRRLAPDL